MTDLLFFRQLHKGPFNATIFFDIFVFLYYRAKKNKSSEYDTKLNAFLANINNIIKSTILSVITDYPLPKTPEELADFETILITKITDAAYDMAFKELCDSFKDDEVTLAALKKLLTKEKVKAFVDVAMKDSNIQEKLTDLYNIILKDDYKAMQELEDEKMKESNEFGLEHSEDFVKPEEDKPLEGIVDPLRQTEEDVINPPKEEDDDSVLEEGTYEEVETEDISDQL